MAINLSRDIPRKTSIRVSYFDNDGKKVGGLTVEDANKVHQLDPSKLFYFQNGDGTEEELTIQQVNQLTPKQDLLPQTPSCSTDPVPCGPPLVKFFGGGGFGATANAIISPVSSSVIGFDIVDSGFGFMGNPSAELMDACGKGSGSSLQVNMEDDDQNTTGISNQNIGASSSGDAASAAAAAALASGSTSADAVSAAAAAAVANGSTIDEAIAAGSAVVDALTSGATSTAASAAGSAAAAIITAGGTPSEAAVAGATAAGTLSNATVAGDNTNTNVGGITEGQKKVINECESPRNSFKNQINRNRERSKKIKNITILAPGDGYIAAPDGSLGGNERVWKEPDEGFVKTKCGGYHVVQPYRPILVKSGDTYYPPNGPPKVLEQDEVIDLPLVEVIPPKPESIGVPYPVLLCIEEIKVLDGGFGYRPGDELVISPNNGTVTELVLGQNGSIEKVKILRGGCGYVDLPKVRTNSPTGFNATFTTIFKPVQIDVTLPIEQQVTGQLTGQPVGIATTGLVIKKKVDPTTGLPIETRNNLITGTINDFYRPFYVPENVELVTVIDCVGKNLPKREFDIVPR